MGHDATSLGAGNSPKRRGYLLANSSAGVSHSTSARASGRGSLNDRGTPRCPRRQKIWLSWRGHSICLGGQLAPAKARSPIGKKLPVFGNNFPFWFHEMFFGAQRWWRFG